MKRILLALAVVSALWATPKTISYQGVLTDQTGMPKNDGSYDIVFSLYGDSVNGIHLWRSTKKCIVQDGLFSAILGEMVSFPDSLDFSEQYWLGLQIGLDAELTPRVILTATGYAIRSSIADLALSATSAVEAAHAVTADSAGKAATALEATHAVAADSAGKAAIALSVSGGAITGDVVTSKVQAKDNTGLALVNASGVGITIDSNGRTTAQFKGSTAFYTADNTQLDRRLTFNVNTPSVARIYNYDETDENFHGINIGTNTDGKGLYVDGANANANVGIGTSTPSEKLEVAGNIKADTLKVDNISVNNIFSNSMQLFSSYTLDSKVTVAAGASANIELPPHLRIPGLPLRYILWINVEGVSNADNSTTIKLHRYNQGAASPWWYEDVVGEWTVKAPNWVDNYITMNMSKLGKKTVRSTSYLKIENIGTKFIEIFAIGVLAEGIPNTGNKNMYIQQ